MILHLVASWRGDSWRAGIQAWRQVAATQAQAANGAERKTIREAREWCGRTRVRRQSNARVRGEFERSTKRWKMLPEAVFRRVVAAAQANSCPDNAPELQHQHDTQQVNAEPGNACAQHNHVKMSFKVKTTQSCQNEHSRSRHASHSNQSPWKTAGTTG